MTHEENKLKTVGTKYVKNTEIYGDAVRETSTSGIESSSWNGDYSAFPGTYSLFFFRGALVIIIIIQEHLHFLVMVVIAVRMWDSVQAWC